VVLVHQLLVEMAVMEFLLLLMEPLQLVAVVVAAVE
jgi:hypothetical protein